MSFKVNCRMCDTCIFSSRSPISDERFEELKAVWEQEGIVQECHHATINGERIACRGHYEAARRGELPHPVMNIAADMELESLRPDQAFGLFEAMGLIVFEDVR